MDDATLSQVTGEPPEELDRWQALGLLPSETPGDTERRVARVRLVQFARQRGIEPERIVAALREQPDLLSFFEEQLRAPVGRVRTVDEAAVEADVDVDLVRTLRHAAGLDDREPLDDDDVATLRSVAVALQAGLPQEALLQLIRVYTAALGRVAEAENRLFHLHVHEQFRRQGLRGPALMSATHAVSDQLLGLVEPTVVYFHRRAFERAALEDMLLHLCEDVTLPGDVAGEMTATVMFIDLAGFTPLTLTMGDAVAAEIVDRFGDIVRGAADRSGGRIVKQIGDAFMIVFGDPAAALGCGLDIEDATAGETHFPAVHIGAHTGPLLYREGDYLGHTVNVAARVAAQAGAHQMLVSGPLHEALKGTAGVDLVALGARSLKGIAEQVHLFEARRGGERAPRLRDPVCGMEIRPGEESARLTWDGHEVAFCSSGCLQAFTADPRAYSSSWSSGR